MFAFLRQHFTICAGGNASRIIELFDCSLSILWEVPVPQLPWVTGMGFFLLVNIAMAGPLDTENVSYKSGEETVTGFQVRPDSPSRHTDVIVIHEWWSLNDWVREQARKLAQQGYLALAVDLYSGKSTADRDEAHELMRGLPQDGAVRDLEASFDYLASLRDVNKA